MSDLIEAAINVGIALVVLALFAGIALDRCR